MEKQALDNFEVDHNASALARQMLVEYQKGLSPAMQALSQGFFQNTLNAVVVLTNKGKPEPAPATEDSSDAPSSGKSD